MVSAELGVHGTWPSAGMALPLPTPGSFSLTHLQFVDTPGNLPSSVNLPHLLGLKKNISILLAYQ